MNTPIETKTVEVEVCDPESDSKLAQYAGQTGLEKQSTDTLVETFRPIFVKSRQAIQDAKGVAESVRDATCVREIARSRACRLALRAVRLESDAARKKHKEHALLYGRAVDGFHNILMADLSPIEKSLQDAEDIAERAEAKRLTDLRAAREAELVPLLDEPLLVNLADLSEFDYVKKLVNAKFLRQAKLDATAKIEAERKTKEEADRIERERIAAENARLKAEVEARDAAYKAEREATRVAVEKKLAEERAEAARVAAEIKAKADAEAMIVADQYAREKAAIEAKAKAEAARIAEVARVERDAALAKAKVESDRLAAIACKERAEIEANLKRASEEAAKARADKLAMEKEIQDRITNEQAQAVAASKAEKKAASAADGVKLKRFADELRSLPKPALKDSKIQSEMMSRIDQLARWVESVASEELL